MLKPWGASGGRNLFLGNKFRNGIYFWEINFAPWGASGGWGEHKKYHEHITQSIKLHELCEHAVVCVASLVARRIPYVSSC